VVNERVDVLAFERAMQSSPEMLLPRTLEDAIKLATVMAKSAIVPAAYVGKPQDVLIAGLLCSSLGISWAIGIKNIALINGRPTMWGDLVLALVKRSGDIEEFTEWGPAEALEKGKGWCRVKRKGYPAIERTFSVEEAKKAGLWTKSGPWQQYPGRMLQMRARSFALRDECPDILNGIDIREEVEDYTYEVVGEAEDGRSIVRPRRLSERKALEAGKPSVVDEFLKGSQAQAPTLVPGGPAAAAPSSPSSNEVVGKVEKVEEKKYRSTRTGQDETFYVVTLSGAGEFASFKPTDADEADVARKKGLSVRITFKTDAKGRKSVLTLAPVADEVADPPPEEPA
jgi:hypothetical protein